MPPQLAGANLPPEVSGAIASGGIDPDLFTSVGDLGANIMAWLPADAKPLFEPWIGAIVEAIYRAFSLATANTASAVVRDHRLVPDIHRDLDR